LILRCHDRNKLFDTPLATKLFEARLKKRSDLNEQQNIVCARLEKRTVDEIDSRTRAPCHVTTSGSLKSHRLAIAGAVSHVNLHWRETSPSCSSRLYREDHINSPSAASSTFASPASYVRPLPYPCIYGLQGPAWKTRERGPRYHARKFESGMMCAVMDREGEPLSGEHDVFIDDDD
jgi:hypothetical protein